MRKPTPSFVDAAIGVPQTRQGDPELHAYLQARRYAKLSGASDASAEEFARDVTLTTQLRLRGGPGTKA